MSRKLLITGATGFVGRHVMRALANADAHFRLIVRTGKEGQVQTVPDRTEVVCSPDLFAEDIAWWARQCEGVDTVIHLAWYAEPGYYLESPKNLDCLIGSLQLAKGAVQSGVSRFLGVGTCFEYDLSRGVLSADTPLKPLTPYADTKAALFMSLSHWLPAAAVEFAWCRLFYLYGEGEDSRRFVPYLRSRLENGKPAELTSGKQIRDFLDVADAGRMIADVALGEQTGPMNICSGNSITIREFAEQIANEYGRADLLKFGTRPDNLVDPPCVIGILNMKTKKLP